MGDEEKDASAAADEVKTMPPMVVALIALLLIGGAIAAASVMMDSKPKKVELRNSTKNNDAGNGAGQANPVVRLETTVGDIEVELWEDEMPWSVNNFIELSENGSYNGTWFHRIIPGFMIQGGDTVTRGAAQLPPNAGSGDPGYRWRDESNEDRTFDRKGLLAMANGGPHTNGAQFFITLVPTPHLNTPAGQPIGQARPHHNIFGEVKSGMDVVDAIAAIPTGAQDRPTQRIQIERVVVVSKRSHRYSLPAEARMP